jgi:glyoxylase-like metal-dependent hydrolase (beta-lactamase superfamily II)
MKLFKVLAGDYWTDGGAMMGVLPWAIWGKFDPTDERRRKHLSLNLLLAIGEGRVILTDTGLGNRLSDKQKDIYRPSEFLLPVSLAELGIRDIEVTDVVMTHLHFDHAGGIVTDFGNEERLTFPNATYWIQASEWEVAKNPDGLNRAAYDFDHQLKLLEEKGRIELVEGERELAPGVLIKRVGGHTTGSQIVELETESGFYIYPGDIISTLFHTSPSITSAYDVCRKDTYKAKQYIYSRLKEKQGFLLLDHDLGKWEIPVSELRV